MVSLVRISIGTVCILLGVAGLILPILQGWLFLGLGLVILAPVIPLFDRIVCRLESKYPQLGRYFHKLDRRKKPQQCSPEEER
jgi:uncharacterized membrane protein YbaN (DUF454 family)